MFGVRIVNADFYMSYPVQGLDVMYSEFRAASVHQVPIIRIFGSSIEGEKTCLHVHRVFPYMYIPFDGSEPASNVMYQIATNLDKSINISLGQASSNVHHIYKILLVSGKPLYGYHLKEHQFFKVFFYNPLIMRKASSLLENGTILGKSYQPHEIHIPFILQFMIDYNLHGMNHILLSEVCHRLDPDDLTKSSSDLPLFNKISKMSCCKVEIDALAEHIMNRLEVSSGQLAVNPGLAVIWEDEKQRRRNNNLDSEIEPCLSQTKKKTVPTVSHVKFRQMLKETIAVHSKKDENVKTDLNNSVYPAETPSSGSILSATETDVSCSPQELNDSTLNDSSILENNYLDNTLMESANTSMFDQEDQALLDMLCNLGENRETEEDSILSQAVKEPQEDEDSENEADLSLPLVHTPVKENFNRNNPGDSLHDLELKIPQLDGSSNGDLLIDELSKFEARHVCSNVCKIGTNFYSREGLLEQLKNPLRRFTRCFLKACIKNGVVAEDNLNESDLFPHYYDSFIKSSNSLEVVCRKKLRRIRPDKQKYMSNQDLNLDEIASLIEAALEEKPVEFLDMPILERDTINEIITSPPLELKQDMDSTALGTLAKPPAKPHLNLKSRIIRRKYKIKKVARKRKIHPADLRTIAKEAKILEMLKSGYKVNFKVIPSVRFYKYKATNLNQYFKIQTPIFKYYVDHKTNKILDSRGNLVCYSSGTEASLPFINIIENKLLEPCKRINPSLLVPFAQMVGTSYKISDSFRFSNQNCEEIREVESVASFNSNLDINSNIINSFEAEESNLISNSKSLSLRLQSEKIIVSSNTSGTIANASNLKTKQKKANTKTKKNEEAKSVIKLAEPMTYNNVVDQLILNIKKLNKLRNSAIAHSSISASRIIKEAEQKKCVKFNDANLTQICLFEREEEMEDVLDTDSDIGDTEVKKNLRKIDKICNFCARLQSGKRKRNLKYRRVRRSSRIASYNTNNEAKSGVEIANVMHVKKICSLDGMNDSSDEENESSKNCRKKINIKQYKALPIESTSKNEFTENLINLGSLDGAPHSSAKIRCKENKSVINKTQVDGSTILNCNKAAQENSIKRKLSFSDCSPLDVTVNEENIGCVLKHKKNRKSLLYSIEERSISDSNGTLNNVSADCVETEIKKTVSKRVNFSSLIRVINEDENCIAFEYDNKHNFIPQPGSSKINNENESSNDSIKYDSIDVISASSESSHKESQESILKLSNDSASATTSSDCLTPYQKVNLAQNTSVCEAKSGMELSSRNLQVWVPKYNAPSRKLMVETMLKYKIPIVRNEEPFYSNVLDVTGRVEIGHNVLKISSKTTADVPDFESNFTGLQDLMNLEFEKSCPNEKLNSMNIKRMKLLMLSDRNCIITPSKPPPSVKEVCLWLENKHKPIEEVNELKKSKIKVIIPTGSDGDSDESLIISQYTPSSQEKTTDSLETYSREISPVLGKSSKKRKRKLNGTRIESTVRKSLLHAQVNPPHLNTSNCQITGVSLNNTFGFKMSLGNLQNAKAVSENQYLTTLVIELHIQTRGNFKPDPQLDPIRALFYSILNDVPEDRQEIYKKTGMFVVQNSTDKSMFLENVSFHCDVVHVQSEKDLVNEFVKFVRVLNPDIFAGYEIEMLSWGYLVERSYVLEINLPQLLSRIPSVSRKDLSFDDKLPGRIILDVWRLMRHEIALQSYNFENILYHVLHQRVPCYSFKDLSFWWEHPTSLYQYKTAEYYLFRVESVIQLLNQLDLIGRTSELARLFGIQFYEVLSRGSQFRVESMMLRLAKPLNYIPVSPSVQQRARMKAPEFLPLILEPESKFYADPVIVLDFQSLYPSMIIAYNYCFSTCLGRVEHLGQNSPFEFGATQLKISKSQVRTLFSRNKLNFSPCGVAFVKPDVRQGILPRMLREILDTRLMVKKSMKLYPNNKTLQRILHSRQLGLKLIANVTYGYTAANFSGRMPCVELGDSVVSKGRETLQRAIDFVDNNLEWRAKVVYGDTDSLFVLVPGRSREDAFRIGSEIAERVTNNNPSPVKLKLEKVYQPCILQTKKRYVGNMYESPEQKQPDFDAKGIETVRRDGCPAASKMLEKCLKMLFDHQDVSIIRKYVVRQFDKLLLGRVSIQDLIFAKEYRGAAGYRPGACVPALELAKRWTAIDKRNEPRCKERVPYVIINGPPGLPLIRLVRSPHELLGESSLHPNALYYITKVIIPPLNRCFNLIGADFNVWFNEMPRRQFQYLPISSPVKKTTISQFFISANCAVCGNQTQTGLCEFCKKESQTSYVVLQDKLSVWEQAHVEIKALCCSCSGTLEVTPCKSLDCPVLYKLAKVERDVQQVTFVRELLVDF